MAASDRLTSLVVRVQPGDLPGRLAVTLADVCSDGSDGVRARATIDVDGTNAEVVAVEVDPPADGALTARLLDGVADTLRARGVERIRIAAEFDL